MRTTRRYYRQGLSWVHRSAVTMTATVVLTTCVALAGCSRPEGTPRAATAAPLPAEQCGQAVTDALRRGADAVRASDPRVAVGIAVIDRHGIGCRSTYNGAETFPTASVVKLLISIDVMVGDPADDRSRTEMETMLATSDDSIASKWWIRRGAGAIISRTRDLIGLPSLSAPDVAGEWGSTRIDAVDVARIWLWVLDAAPDSVRSPILAGTGAAHEIAADGFNQFFGIPDALPKTTWWIKQGWGSSRGRRVINTTGVIGAGKDHILVMLTSHPLSVGFRVATMGATDGVGALARAVG